MLLQDVIREFLMAAKPQQTVMTDRETIRQTTAELRELQTVTVMLIGSLQEMQDTLQEALDLAEKAEQVKWYP